MRAIALYAAWCCTGCGFQHGALGGGPSDASPGDGDSSITGDAPIDALMIGIDFLPASEETFGSSNYNPTTNVLVDTTAMTVMPSLPSGVTFTVGMQDDGTAIAIWRANDFTIASGRTFAVTGEKPLAILAGHDMTITGILDVGGKLGTRGPGGSPPSAGPGAGVTGVHDDGTGSTYDDSGGGGASFGTSGAHGGDVGNFAGGNPGTTYTLVGLRGGSGGGAAGVCSNVGGAGGGAVLLYAVHKMHINGFVNAGGGGGGGGVISCATGSGAGAGGGSGGAIWVQSSDLDGAGVLAANGGGGGGASYVNVADGGNGQDGKASMSSVATGGTKANSSEASVGGNGAIQGTGATSPGDLNAGNGGGGGGGLGRIVIHAPSIDQIKSSPTAAAL
jgi:hypothetical protein